MRHFFFYGTLIAGSGNSVEATIHTKLVPAGPARARGRLFAIPDADGWYPALLPGNSPVHGVAYRFSPAFGAGDLALLDEYEGHDPNHPQSSLYVRRPIFLRGKPKGPDMAQAYFFNQPLPAAARRVKGGDFHSWLKKNRLQAYHGQ